MADLHGKDLVALKRNNRAKFDRIIAQRQLARDNPFLARKAAQYGKTLASATDDDCRVIDPRALERARALRAECEAAGWDFSLSESEAL